MTANVSVAPQSSVPASALRPQTRMPPFAGLSCATAPVARLAASSPAAAKRNVFIPIPLYSPLFSARLHLVARNPVVRQNLPHLWNDGPADFGRQRAARMEHAAFRR